MKRSRMRLTREFWAGEHFTMEKFESMFGVNLAKTFNKAFLSSVLFLTFSKIILTSVITS